MYIYIDYLKVFKSTYLFCRYLAAGGEDGCVYLYDTRRVTGCLERISTGCDVIMDVAFSPRQPQLVAVTLDGVVLSYKS